MSIPTTPKRVLIIEDEYPIRAVIQACLVSLAKWEVYTAASGKEGIQHAIQQQPDAILLDVSMPEMDGIATFQKLQENSLTNTIPVIFLTAKVQPSDQAQYAELGIAGLITKPFDPVQLSIQIATILGWN